MNSNVSYIHFDDTPDLYKDANITSEAIFSNKDIQNNNNLNKSFSIESDASSSTKLLDNQINLIKEKYSNSFKSLSVNEIPLKGQKTDENTLWGKFHDTYLINVGQKYFKTTNSRNKKKRLKKFFDNKFLILLTITAFAFIIIIIGITTLLDYLSQSSKMYRQFIIDDVNFQTRRWWKNAFFYKIFPVSFVDTNNDGYGDFEGISSSLTYFKSIEINVIHLSSIFKSQDYPSHYVNVVNFTETDSHLGDINQFVKLLKELHAEDIRLILDINPSVTSYKHPWAIEWIIQQSDYFRYFYVNKTMKVHNFAFQLETGQLLLNWSNPFVQYEMLKCFHFWLNLGIDGLFIQNLEYLYFDKENAFEILKILQRMRKQLNQGSQQQILISSYHSLKIINTNFQKQYLASNSKQKITNRSSQTNSTLNLFDYFDCINIFLSIKSNQTEKIRDQVNDIYLATPKNKSFSVLWNIRELTEPRLADRIEKKFINAAVFLLTMLPGSVNLFNGDEVGLTVPVDSKLKKNDLNQQFNSMPWSMIKNKNWINGSLTPWIPIDSSDDNVQRQSKTLLKLAQLIIFRKKFLNKDSNYLFHYVNEGEIVIERFTTGPERKKLNRYVFFANLGKAEKVKDFSDKFQFGEIKFTTDLKKKREFLYLRSLKLEPGEAIIAKVE